jgi:hypothetical protein
MDDVMYGTEDLEGEEGLQVCASVPVKSFCEILPWFIQPQLDMDDVTTGDQFRHVYSTEDLERRACRCVHDVFLCASFSVAFQLGALGWLAPVGGDWAHM